MLVRISYHTVPLKHHRNDGDRKMGLLRLCRYSVRNQPIFISNINYIYTIFQVNSRLFEYKTTKFLSESKLLNGTVIFLYIYKHTYKHTHTHTHNS